MERRWVHETSLRTTYHQTVAVRLVGGGQRPVSASRAGAGGLHRVELPDLRRGVMRFARDVRDQPGG